MKSTFTSTGLLMVVGTVMAAFMASLAQAGPIIDKGSLGKYERSGRFVRSIPTGQATDSVAKEDLAAHQDQTRLAQAKDEKPKAGAKGQSKRRASSGKPFVEPKYRIVDHKKHIHRYPG